MNKQKSLVSRLYRQLLPAQMLLACIGFINTTFDSMIVGALLGYENLAATGLTRPVTILLTACCTIMAYGSQIHAGRALGKGDIEGVNRVFSSTIALSVILGFLYTAMVMLLAHPIASALGGGHADAHIIGLAADYIRGLGPGAIFTLLAIPMVMFAQMGNSKKVSLLSTGIMFLTNIVGDLLAVLVWKNGMFGIGFATSMSYMAAAAVNLIFFLFSSSEISFHRKKISPALMRRMIVDGLPGGLDDMMVAIKSIAINQALITFGGSVALSVYAVFSSVSGLFGGIIKGNFNSMGICSALFIGEDNRRDLKELIHLTMKMTILVGCIVYVGTSLLAGPIVLSFGIPKSQESFAANGLRWMTIYFVINWLHMPARGIYTGFANKIPVYLSGFTGLAFILLGLWIVPIHIGITGVWLFALYENLGNILGIFSYGIYKNRRLPKSPVDAIWLPEDFGAGEGSYLSASFTDLTGLSEFCLAAEQFCLKKGQEAHRSRICALCIEELVYHTITECFRAEGNRYRIDIRIVNRAQEISLIMHDNCSQFDPIERSRLYRKEDPEKYLGLHLAIHLATDAKFVYSYRFNMLYLKL